MFTTAVRSKRDLGVLSVSLNVLTGHRSLPRRIAAGPEIRPPQGLAPVTDAFPAGVRLDLLETGIQVIRLSPCHADLPVHRPWHLGTATGFLPCYFPLLSFRTPVRHQIQRYLLSSLPAARAIQQCASWRTLGSNRASHSGSSALRTLPWLQRSVITGIPSGLSFARLPAFGTYTRRTARGRQDRMVRCRSEEHTSELQSHSDLVCRLLLEKKKLAAEEEAREQGRVRGVFRELHARQ